MKLKSKLISIVTATLLVSTTFVGCGEDTSTTNNTTGGTSQIVSNPKGTVTGLVQDTNGNPISGANIYLAGRETTTDAGGVYIFKDIPVVQTYNINLTDATLGNELSVTIIPPSGYIGSTVTVRPAAQISSSENTINGVETFIDGFIAQAGTAVLPDTNSSVTGVLRDSTTGEPISSSVVNFEFLSTALNINQEQPQNGVTTSYAVSTYSKITAEDGSFSYSSLPSDSTFKILVPGYTVNSAVQFSTDDEPVKILGNIEVTPISALDNLHPYISSVNNVISASTNTTGLLDDDTRNTFVVNFSETLDLSKIELDGNSILVYAGDLSKETKIPYSATIDSTNKIITISTTATLNDGDSVHILFLKSDLQDTSGNPLVNSNIVGYDYDFGPSNEYIKLQLKIFKQANIEAPAINDALQLDQDTLGLNDDKLIQEKSDAFKDVLDGTVKFQQLNSADNDDNLSGSDTEERLNALVQKLGGAGVENGKTRVSFTPSGAYAYILTVTDKDENPKPQSNIFGITNAFTDNIDIANSADFNGTATSYLVTKDMNNVEIYLNNVIPTDVVTITSTDSLGYMGTPYSITLKDTVPPTTILQKSYYAGTATAGESSAGVIVDYGDGGELSNTQNTLTVGTPYLAITNSLLDNQDANGEDVSTGTTADKTLKTELYNLSVIDTTTGIPYINGTGMYDAEAFSKFNIDTKLQRRIGVAFSEDVNLTGTPVYSGTNISLSNFTVNNDVVINVNGTTVNSDLIDMDVSNILKLANLDNLASINYSSVIEDLAGNNATVATNANVVIKDEMAPFVVSALYRDTTANLTITFNEAIHLVDAVSSIKLGTANTTYNALATENQWSLDTTGTVLTIPYGAFDSSINKETFWTSTSVPAYKYPNDNYNVGTDTPLDHAQMIYSTISDTQGNSWNTYTTNSGTNAIEIPTFATAQYTTGFITSSANNITFDGATDTTATAVTVSWSFTQPIDPSSGMFSGVTADATTGKYTLTNEATISSYFDFTGAATSFITGTSLTLSADKKTITLQFLTNNDMSAGDKLTNNTTITSEGDTDQQIDSASQSNPIVTAI